MVVKAEHTARGSNPRFVVTNLPGTDDYPTGTVGLYNRVYCARGDMENRLKDQQLDLFAAIERLVTVSGPTSSGSCCRLWPIP